METVRRRYDGWPARLSRWRVTHVGGLRWVLPLVGMAALGAVVAFALIGDGSSDLPTVSESVTPTPPAAVPTQAPETCPRGAGGSNAWFNREANCIGWSDTFDGENAFQILLRFTDTEELFTLGAMAEAQSVGVPRDVNEPDVAACRRVDYMVGVIAIKGSVKATVASVAFNTECRPIVVESLVPLCSAESLLLSIGGDVSPPTGYHPLMIQLENTGQSACRLFGYPRLELLDDSGVVVPFHFYNGPSQLVTAALPREVVLDPGDAAFVLITKYRCDAGQLSVATTLRLRVGVDPAAVTWTWPKHGNQGLGWCGQGAAGSGVSVSPFSATAADTLRRP